LSWLALLLLGVWGGFFAVPLQVLLQSRPPEDQKGRMIGTMNLINWIGIVFSAGFYHLGSAHLPAISWIFAALAALMLPVAMFYRPKDSELR